MSSYVAWTDIRAEHVARVGEEEAAEAGKRGMLAEVRRARGLTQQQVTDRMGVTKCRVFQIEHGKNSGQDVVAPYAPRRPPPPGNLLRQRRHHRHRLKLVTPVGQSRASRVVCAQVPSDTVLPHACLVRCDRRPAGKRSLCRGERPVGPATDDHLRLGPQPGDGFSPATSPRQEPTDRPGRGRQTR